MGLIGMLFLALAWTALAQQPAGEIPLRFPESLVVQWREDRADSSWQAARNSRGDQGPDLSWTIPHEPPVFIRTVRSVNWFQEEVSDPIRISRSNVASSERMLASGRPLLLFKPWRLPVALSAVLAGVGVGLVWARSRSQLRAQREELERLLAQVQVENLFPPDGRLPEALGPLKILRKLGDGGMARVFEVQTPEGRSLALKAPYPQLAGDTEFRKRFGREMLLSSRLLHPNIVRVESVHGTLDPSEYPFYLMEMVQGRTWAALPLPLSESVLRDYAQQLLRALEVIHAQGIVHRDLKPENLMITDTGVLKVMDFGVARDDRGTRYTVTGSAVGTPIYMAPEQLRGASDLDHRCDLYAAGLIFYQSLSGQLPFSDDLGQLLTEKLSMRLPDLRAGALGELIMRMCETRPEDRPASAAEARAAFAGLA